MRRPSTSLLLSLLVSLLALPACGEEIPENPTWTNEVEGILRANCVRCHGAVQPDIPGLEPIPTSFRLDVYADAKLKADEGRILARAVELADMPPDSYLTPHQKEILAAWLEDDAPE